MKKYRCYYTNDLGDDYDALSAEHADGEWYRASEADDVMAGASQALNNAKARIRELEQRISELRTYCGHKEDCALLMPSDFCDCGLDALLASE